MNKLSNHGQSTGGITQVDAVTRGMPEYDSLPPKVRKAFQEATYCWGITDKVLSYYRAYGADRLIQLIKERDRALYAADMKAAGLEGI